MSASRGRIVALVVLLGLGVLLGAVAVATSGSGSEGDGGLKIELSSGQVSVYVAPADNVEEKARTRSVTLECVDSGGKVVHRSQQGWPFGDTDKGAYDPHTHVGVAPGVERRVDRCRLIGTDLAGRPSVR